MKSIDAAGEVRRIWWQILQEQGRSMSWLAQQTGKTYPQIASYRYGTAKVPEAWLREVETLLGEPVR